MLLTLQQRYVLNLLRQLKCLRQDQAGLLMRRAFPRRDGRELSTSAADTILCQLRHCTSDVLMEDGLVRLASAKPNVQRLEAVDVMLELTDGRVQNISLGREPPVLLRFVSGGERLRLFTISDLDAVLPQTLSDIFRQKSERLIWISGSGHAPERLFLPPGHFFAARQEDGSHRFYSGDGS